MKTNWFRQSNSEQMFKNLSHFKQEQKRQRLNILWVLGACIENVSFDCHSIVCFTWRFHKILGKFLLFFNDLFHMIYLFNHHITLFFLIPSLSHPVLSISMYPLFMFHFSPAVSHHLLHPLNHCVSPFHIYSSNPLLFLLLSSSWPPFSDCYMPIQCSLHLSLYRLLLTHLNSPHSHHPFTS